MRDRRFSCFFPFQFLLTKYSDLTFIDLDNLRIYQHMQLGSLCCRFIHLIWIEHHNMLFSFFGREEIFPVRGEVFTLVDKYVMYTSVRFLMALTSFHKFS